MRDNMARLYAILCQELADCYLLYNGGRTTESEIKNVAHVWTRTLCDVFGFDGDEEVLREAFLVHRQNENFFPRPCHVRPALYHKKPAKDGERFPGPPADPRLPINICKALKGDEVSREWIMSFIGENNGKGTD